MCHGIQNVMFAWLVAIILQESPIMVGVAQVALLVPTALLLLLGGDVADRFGGQRVAFVSQALAVIPAAFLCILLLFDQLSYPYMIVYAIGIGTLQAFVTPARDGLLNQVARGDIHRTVVKFTLIQFSSQMIGIALAGSADSVGGAAILGTQAVILAIGAVAFRMIRTEVTNENSLDHSVKSTVMTSIVEGFNTVWRNRYMRTVVIQNLAMGMCFMGSYIVTIPLLVREQFGGSAADLAMVNFANSIGLVLMIIGLLFIRQIRNKRRALLMAQGIGAIILALASLQTNFYWFVSIMFLWGACGGISMSVARIMMQEEAPIDQRGRVMSFFSFSFMGAGPIGAMIWGTAVEYLGPSTSLGIASLCVFVVVITLAISISVTRKRGRQKSA